MVLLLLLGLFVVMAIIAGFVRGRVRDQYRSPESQDMELYGDQMRNRPIDPFL